jgi:hypothetical protein
MVKVCKEHTHEVERGCTYELTPTGISEIKGKIKDSECVICIKLRKLNDLTDLITRELIGLKLVNYINDEPRLELLLFLHDMIDWKIRECW